MKLFLVAFALIASTAADVSHLNREYLPPVQHGHHSGSASSHYGAVSGGASVGSSGSSHHGSVGGGVSHGSSSGSHYSAAGGGASHGASSSSHHRSVSGGVSHGSNGGSHYSAGAGHSGAASYGHGHQAQAVHASYGSAPVAAPAPVAPAPVAPAAAAPAKVSYGSYSHVADEQQYQGAAEVAHQEVDSGVSGDAGDASAAYGVSYDLSSQNAGVQELGHNSLVIDSYGNNVGAHESHVSLTAAHGPAIRAPQPASYTHSASHDAVQQYVSGGAVTSSGVETQYASNGGYIY